MKTTSVSLLERLQAAKPDDPDWHRLHDIYLPHIRQWLARIPGLRNEAADLSQEVLVVLVREISHFERRREGSFRAWLRQVTVNKVRTHWKLRNRRPNLDGGDQFLDQLADPNGELAREWDRDHDQHVFQNLLSIVRSDFNLTTWTAFQRFAIEGVPAAKVAQELGLSVNAVLQAKSRVLKRLRHEAGELLN